MALVDQIGAAFFASVKKGESEAGCVVKIGDSTLGISATVDDKKGELGDSGVAAFFVGLSSGDGVAPPDIRCVSWYRW